jgi:hypothetical protein
VIKTDHIRDYCDRGKDCNTELGLRKHGQLDIYSQGIGLELVNGKLLIGGSRDTGDSD